MSLGPWQIIIIAVVVVLLFGRGKISELMGDVAKGINSFKKGLKEEDQDQDQVDAISEDDSNVIDVKSEKSKTNS